MVPKWITDLLDRNGVQYQRLQHRDTFTAQQLAHAEHVAGRRVAKVVVAMADNQPLLLVLPANRRVDLEKVRELAHCPELRLATEEEMERHFPECEPGAVPPLRPWRECEILSNGWLDVDGDIVFAAGTHRDAIQMPFRQWLELVNPRMSVFSEPLQLATSADL